MKRSGRPNAVKIVGTAMNIVHQESLHNFFPTTGTGKAFRAHNGETRPPHDKTRRRLQQADTHPVSGRAAF